MVINRQISLLSKCRFILTLRLSIEAFLSECYWKARQSLCCSTFLYAGPTILLAIDITCLFRRLVISWLGTSFVRYGYTFEFLRLSWVWCFSQASHGWISKEQAHFYGFSSSLLRTRSSPYPVIAHSRSVRFQSSTDKFLLSPSTVFPLLPPFSKLYRSKPDLIFLFLALFWPLVTISSHFL